jgi:hypothetical protein
MTSLVALSGSLREGSFNGALLRAAAGLVPPDVELRIASIRGIPLYDADVEAAEGVPAAVQALKDAIAAADGLLLATPEYNNAMPGVAKNAIDWLSRPPADIPRVFGGQAGRADRRVARRLRHPARPERLVAGGSAPSAPVSGRKAGWWCRGRRRCSRPTARSPTRRCGSAWPPSSTVSSRSFAATPRPKA